ncbi:MAG: A/G-specific adenine glycosylase [Magnetococcales bacterium]|nr:A/G-specific adenine glycosylase [Magnetococcales bacterium]
MNCDAKQQAANRLLDFYDRHGRTLPWRQERDLYRIWVSEIMLQQTGVTTVIPYYQRFITHFKTVQALAQAERSEVLHLWQGLGYYQRGRNLHGAAIEIVRNHGGVCPEQIQQWLALPGIGPSTAAAILAIGRNQPHTILDGNVKRVLSRRVALQEPVDSTAGKKKLWQIARSLTSVRRPGDYAQAIMDLGAMVCRQKNPSCDRCPWQGECQAHQLGQESCFPVKAAKAKPKKPHLYQTTVLIRHADGRQLLRRRPERGLLAGLWEPLSTDPYPNPPTQPSTQSVFDLLTQWGIEGKEIQYVGQIDHSFTHFHLTAHTFQAVCKQEAADKSQKNNHRWLNAEEIETRPRSTLHKKIMALAGQTV